MKHVEFLVEEDSAEALLKGLLPKLLPAGVSFAIHPFQGKRELLTHGFEQPYEKPDGTRAVEHIHMVDWVHPLENDLCVVNQLPIRE